jgi:hypothetical protein
MLQVRARTELTWIRSLKGGQRKVLEGCQLNDLFENWSVIFLVACHETVIHPHRFVGAVISPSDSSHCLRRNSL